MTSELAPRSLADRLVELDQLASRLSEAVDEDELLARAGAALYRVFDLDWASIAFRSGDGRRFRLVALHPDGSRPGSGTTLAADLLASNRVISRGPVLHEADLTRSRYPDLVGLADNELVSAVVLALEVGGLPIGALTVARRQGRPFDEGNVLLLLHAGALLAAGLKHRRTLAEAERAETERQKASLVLARRAAEIGTLHRMAAGVDRHDLPRSVATVASEIAAMRGIELCRITAVDGGVLVVVASGAQYGATFQDASAPAGPESPDVLAVSLCRPVLWQRSSTAADNTAAALRRLGVTSVFALPIMIDGNPIGALTAGSTGGHRLVTDEHVVLADIACRQLADAAGSASRLRSVGAQPGSPPPDNRHPVGTALG